MANYKDNTTGHNTFVTLGASNHTEDIRSDNDFYATPPIATEHLLEVETFNKHIWEPACGMNHIVNILEDKGYDVFKSDIINYLNDDRQIIDFLNTDIHFDGDIITNPPFNRSVEFVLKALDSVNDGAKVAMFLKLQFLETKKRYDKIFSKYPPKVIYIASSRYGCSKTGEFNEDGNIGSAICYCWYIWEKGYKGDIKIKFINT